MIIRRFDDLGRIVVPEKLRKYLKITEDTPIEISVSKDGYIILAPYTFSKDVTIK